MSSTATPIFYDPRGRRRRRLRRTWLALAVIATSLAAMFIASVLANPLLPRLNLRPIASLPHAADLKPSPPNVPANPSALKAKRAQAELQRVLAKTKRVVPSKQASQTAIVASPPALPPPAIPANRPLAIGFYINWDESSYASLTRNADHLDWLIPEWAHLQDGPNGPIGVDIYAPALNFVRETRPQLRIIPLVENLTDEKWNSELLARSVADESSRQRLIQTLTQFVEQNRFSGLCIDFEEPPDATQANLLQFMRELHAVFQQRSWTLLQTVPFDDQDWNYREYAAATDYLVLALLHAASVLKLICRSRRRRRGWRG